MSYWIDSTQSCPSEISITNSGTSGTDGTASFTGVVTEGCAEGLSAGFPTNTFVIEGATYGPYDSTSLPTSINVTFGGNPLTLNISGTVLLPVFTAASGFQGQLVIQSTVAAQDECGGDVNAMATASLEWIAPVAVIVESQPGNSDNRLFDGTTSQDSSCPAGINTYAWSLFQSDGTTALVAGTDYTLNSADLAQTTLDVDFANAGDYVVCLDVTTDCGTNQTCENLTIVIPPPTSIPIATSVGAGNFTADGSTSTDNACGSGITAYLWDIQTLAGVSLVQGTDYTLNSANLTSSTVDITFANAGDYRFCLTVTSDCGTDTQYDNVNYAIILPTSVPVAQDMGDGNFLADGSTSVDNGCGGGIIAYLWEVQDATGTALVAGTDYTLNSANLTSATLDVTFPAVVAQTDFRLELTVTSACGQDTEFTTVTVYPPPVSDPSVTGTNPYSATGAASTDESCPSGITAYSWDIQQPLGTSLTVGTDFTVDAGSLTGQTVDVTITNPVVGDYFFELTVTTDCGTDTEVTTVSYVEDCTPFDAVEATDLFNGPFAAQNSDGTITVVVHNII